ncbi:MAG: aromatic ring-hydroxylating dioxygenase subunit alpha [Kiloniellales bacterium]
MKHQSLTLRAGDRPFCDDAARSFTLPARFYHDASVFELEKEAIFYRSWWYAGHVSQVAEPGAFLTTRIHEQNVFVARTRQGDLKAFYNVCPHRGHKLLEGSGRKNIITCPYHAWAFDFDGSLKVARNAEKVADFDRSAFSLKPVQVEVFCGLVMVNLDPDARSFKEQSGDLEAEIRHYMPQVDALSFAQRDSYDVRANWKVMIDNFLECYHCHTAHKDFVDLVDMPSYRTRAHGIYSSHCSDRVKTEESKAFSFVKGAVDFSFAGWFVWPNITIWAYPGEPNLSVLQMNPTEPERCIEFQDWFVPGGRITPQLKEAIDYQIDVLQPEDIGLCESVQEGLKSRGYNQGRLMVDAERSELSEHGVHHFQKLVADALGASLNPE